MVAAVAVDHDDKGEAAVGLVALRSGDVGGDLSALTQRGRDQLLGRSDRRGFPRAGVDVHVHGKQRFVAAADIVHAEVGILCVPLHALRVAGGAGGRCALEVDAAVRGCRGDLPDGVILLVEAHAVVGAAIGLIADGELFAVGALQEEAALGLFDRPDDLVVIGGQDAVDRRDIDARAVVGAALGIRRGHGLADGAVDEDDLCAVGQLGAEGILIVLQRGLRFIDDGDTALACEVLVLLADIAAEGIDDVVDEDLVVDLDLVLQELVVLEHVDAVAAGLEHVVMGGEGVGLGGVDRLVGVGGLVQDLNVLHAARAFHGDEGALVVRLDGGFHGGVDGVLHAGDLQEAAHLADGVIDLVAVLIDGLGNILGHRVAGGHFQRIEDLLTGGFHDAGHVAIGMDLDDLIVGDVACGDVGADAAAVDDGDVSAQRDAVSIGAQVAEVRLAVADGAGRALGVLGGEVNVRVGDDLVQQGLELCDDLVDDFLRLGVLFDLTVADELAVDLAVGADGQLAEVVQLRARGGENDVLAVLALDDLLRDGAVGMAVEHGVQAGGVGDDVRGAPRLGGLVDTEVCDGHDVVGAVLLRGVNGLLHGVVQVLTVVALGEGIDVVAVLVLEVGGRGLHEALRGADADDGDLLAAEGLDGIGLHTVDGGAVQSGKVAGQVLILCGRDDGVEQLIHAVVKLMVAERGIVIAGGIHDLDDGFAVRQGGDGLALDGVARIDQQAVRGLEVVAVPGDLLIRQRGGFAGAAGDVRVNIVGVEDHDVVGLRVIELHVALDDGGELGAGGVVLWGELAVLAVDDAGLDGPLHGAGGVVIDLIGIRPIAQVLLGGSLASVAPGHGDELFAGDEACGVERAVAAAVDDLLLCGPCDGITVPCIHQIGEGSLGGGSGLTGDAPQNHGSLRAGQIRLRFECRCRGAVHQSVVINVLNVRSKPVGVLHIRERADVCRKRKRQHTCDHGNDQQHRHELRANVFHD